MKRTRHITQKLLNYNLQIFKEAEETPKRPIIYVGVYYCSNDANVSPERIEKFLLFANPVHTHTPHQSRGSITSTLEMKQPAK